MNRDSAVTITATASAVIVLLGVQGIAPVTPDIRDEFGLDVSSLSAFTFVYVLGAAVFGFPMTGLADRIGIRPVLVGSLGVFGVLGIVGALSTDYLLLLGVRLVQGSAFGAVIALTVVLTSVEGSPLETARRLRSRTIAMAMGEALLPFVVGLIASSLSWRAGFALQSLAIAAAAACLLVIPAEVRNPAARKGGAMGLALRTLATPFGAAAQLPALARFIVKFSILTYVPVIVADTLGLDAAATGAIIGASALVAVGAAAIAPTVLARLGTGGAVSVALALAAAPLLFMPLVAAPVPLIAIMVLSGVGDGLLGVFINVLASAAAPAGARAAYLGLSGSLRNGAKVLAPAGISVLLLVMPVAATLLVAGAVGLLPLAAIPVVVRGMGGSRSD